MLPQQQLQPPSNLNPIPASHLRVAASVPGGTSVVVVQTPMISNSAVINQERLQQTLLAQQPVTLGILKQPASVQRHQTTATVISATKTSVGAASMPGGGGGATTTSFQVSNLGSLEPLPPSALQPQQRAPATTTTTVRQVTAIQQQHQATVQFPQQPLPQSSVIQQTAPHQAATRIVQLPTQPIPQSTVSSDQSFVPFLCDVRPHLQRGPTTRESSENVILIISASLFSHNCSVSRYCRQIGRTGSCAFFLQVVQMQTGRIPTVVIGRAQGIAQNVIRTGIGQPGLPQNPVRVVSGCAFFSVNVKPAICWWSLLPWVYHFLAGAASR